MEDTDYIIVGSGLAGIALAHTLRREGYRFKIISKPQLSQCSLIAAGIYNPVVFYRITKSYMADMVLPYAINFYKETEKELGVDLIHEYPVAKIFANEIEVQLWEKRREEGVGIYLGDSNKTIDETTGIGAPHGFGLVKQTGNLDCAKYISASISYFKESWIEEQFDYHKIEFGENGITYKSIHARKIIFCEGHLVSQNPFFDSVVLKPVKGEILTIRFDEKLPQGVHDYILNKKCYLLPIGDNTYKAGATYNWKELNEETTNEGVKELMQNIKDITSIGFSIISQSAGIRPAAADRRPLLGAHPYHLQLNIFNGLGTKGVMLAPYFANELMQFICNGKALHKEVDVERVAGGK